MAIAAIHGVEINCHVVGHAGPWLHRLPIALSKREPIPFEEWTPPENEIAAVFVDLMRRTEPATATIA